MTMAPTTLAFLSGIWVGLIAAPVILWVVMLILDSEYAPRRTKRGRGSTQGVD
jgi:hypothetical protein